MTFEAVEQIFWQFQLPFVVNVYSRLEFINRPSNNVTEERIKNRLLLFSTFTDQSVSWDITNGHKRRHQNALNGFSYPYDFIQFDAINIFLDITE